MKTMVATIIFLIMVGYVMTLHLSKDIINKRMSQIGETIIINSDTLIITDYNFHYSRFSLSNGAVINTTFADSLLTIQNKNLN